jgi:hypothetical protein
MAVLLQRAGQDGEIHLPVLVVFRTESGMAACRPDMLAYLEQEMDPAARRLGASARVVDNPDVGGGPFLIAHRHEADDLPTVLTYASTGQHTINLAALEQVLRAGDDLAADLLIASDGLRVAAGRPTVFLGSRSSAWFTLRVPLRERAYHSGNWGGLLRNPVTVLASAVACLVWPLTVPCLSAVRSIGQRSPAPPAQANLCDARSRLACFAAVIGG